MIDRRESLLGMQSSSSSLGVLSEEEEETEEAEERQDEETRQSMEMEAKKEEDKMLQERLINSYKKSKGTDGGKRGSTKIDRRNLIAAQEVVGDIYQALGKGASDKVTEQEFVGAVCEIEAFVAFFPF